MTESGIEFPTIGDEAPVHITPSVKSDEKWIERGLVLATRREPFGVIVGSIQIIGAATTDENPSGRQADQRWHGCVVAAVFDKYSHAWRATCPVSDCAKSVWAKCLEVENGN